MTALRRWNRQKKGADCVYFDTLRAFFFIRFFNKIYAKNIYTTKLQLTIIKFCDVHSQLS